MTTEEKEICIKIVGSIVSVSFILFPYFFPFNPLKRWYKQIASWVFIVLGLVFGFLTYSGVLESKEKTSSPTIKYIPMPFPKDSIVYISKNNSIIKYVDSSMYNVVPFVDLEYSWEALNVSYTSGFDSMVIKITMQNHSQTNACNFLLRWNVIAESNGYYSEANIKYPLDTNATIVPTAMKVYKCLPIPCAPHDPSSVPDTLFVRLAGHYSNSYNRCEKKYRIYLYWLFKSNTWVRLTDPAGERIDALIDKYHIE